MRLYGFFGGGFFGAKRSKKIHNEIEVNCRTLGAAMIDLDRRHRGSGLGAAVHIASHRACIMGVGFNNQGMEVR